MKAASVIRCDVDSPAPGYVRLGITDDQGNDHEFVMLVEQAAMVGTSLTGLAQINEEDEA